MQPIESIQTELKEQNQLSEDYFVDMTETTNGISGEQDQDFDVSAALHEVEEEIGIADWIDPETGELAECLTPHFGDE